MIEAARSAPGLALGVALLVMLAACAPRASDDDAAALGDRTRCAAYRGLPAHWREQPHAGMVNVRGGAFALGSTRGYAEERPVVEIRVDGFWIDRTEVTRAQFASFVTATGYVSEAERHDGAVVFRAPTDDAEALQAGRWWQLDRRANWRRPDGTQADADHEPVVDVTYADAQAYAHWLHRELPTEAQWEFAARAGRDNATADAALRDARGHPLANFWQGMFPVDDRAEDGYAGRAPVGCFAANPDGLHDMVGNVWEWTADVYRDGHASAEEQSAMATMPAHGGGERRVIKGGSYLCADNYCVRARAASRQGQEADLPSEHIGFRTVARD